MTNRYFVDLTDGEYTILDEAKGYDLSEYNDGELLDITRYIFVLGYSLVTTVDKLTADDDLRACKAILLFDCDKQFRQAIKDAKTFDELKQNIYEVADDLRYYDYETETEYSNDSELYEHGIYEVPFTKYIPLGRSGITLTGMLEYDCYDSRNECFIGMDFNTNKGDILLR